MQRELKNVFRAPDYAYSSMDFSGRGLITEEDFMASIAITRVLDAKTFTQEDISEFLK